MATTSAEQGSRTASASPLARALETDFSRPASFALLAIAFFAVRLPFINDGHGTDPDAWRVAITAHHLLDSGKYFPSRLPGNPLHELIMTPLIPGGWLATNFATALAALGGVWIFARIVATLRLPHAGLLTVGFAFTPLLVINSIATMDYMWTLTAILGAYYAVLRGQPLVAGLCIGAAIGLRLQSVILFLPFAFLFWRLGSRRDLPVFGLAAGGVAALAFAPVLATYGTSFYNYYDAAVGYQDVLRLLGKEALGVGGGMGVLIGAALSLPSLVRLGTEARRDAQVGFWLLLIATYFATFLRLPHEIAYLIPVFPFGILLMGRYFGRTALAIAIGAIMLAGVVDITTPGSGFDAASIREASIGEGLLLSNSDTQKAQAAFVRTILAAEVPDHSVVLTGFSFPQLAVRGRDRLDTRILERDYDAISMLTDRGEAVDEEHDIRYVWLLTYDTFAALRSQGYSFFLVPDAVGGTSALYGYRPTLFGATFLTLDRAAPSAGEGSAGTDR